MKTATQDEPQAQVSRLALWTLFFSAVSILVMAASMIMTNSVGLGLLASVTFQAVGIVRANQNPSATLFMRCIAVVMVALSVAALIAFVRAVQAGKEMTPLVIGLNSVAFLLWCVGIVFLFLALKERRQPQVK